MRRAILIRLAVLAISGGATLAAYVALALYVLGYPVGWTALCAAGLAGGAIGVFCGLLLGARR